MIAARPAIARSTLRHNAVQRCRSMTRTLPTPWKPTKAQVLAARNTLVPDLIAKNLIVLHGKLFGPAVPDHVAHACGKLAAEADAEGQEGEARASAPLPPPASRQGHSNTRGSRSTG